MTTITILMVCGAIGVADTLYLLWHKFRGTDVACPFFPDAWCRKVQYSQHSKTLGIPNSILGFLLYSGILVLTLAAPESPYWLVQKLVLLGFLFSLYFTYVQAFVLRAFCTWCVVSALNFAVMFWAVFVR